MAWHSLMWLFGTLLLFSSSVTLTLYVWFLTLTQLPFQYLNERLDTMFGAVPRMLGESRAWTWYSRVPQDDEDKDEEGGGSGTPRPRGGPRRCHIPFWPTMLCTSVGLFVVFAVVMMVVDRNQFPPQFPPTRTFSFLYSQRIGVPSNLVFFSANHSRAL